MHLREGFSASANAEQELAGRQALVGREVVEEVLDITAEVGHLTGGDEAEHRRVAVGSLVEAPAGAGNCGGGDWGSVAV